MPLGQRGSHVVRRPDGASHGERVHQKEGDVHVRHPRLGWSRVVVECHCSGARTRWSVPCRRGEVKTQSTRIRFGTDGVENRGVTRIELAATSIGRAVQARIYREGAFGRLPTVPVSPAALERAARRRMSRAAFAYVAGAAGQERTARRQHRGVRTLVGRAADDARHARRATRRSSCSAAGCRHPCCSRRSACWRWRTADADVAVAEAASSLGLPMVFSTQASRSMEDCAAVMGAARAGTSSTGAARTTLVGELRVPGRGGPAARPSW